MVDESDLEYWEDEIGGIYPPDSMRTVFEPTLRFGLGLVIGVGIEIIKAVFSIGKTLYLVFHDRGEG